VSGEELRVLAEEQAALRRVATLVARGAAPEDVFAAIAEEVGQLLAVDFAYMGRYEPEGAVTIIAAWARAGRATPVGSRFMLGGRNLGTRVFETGRTTRFDTLADASGPVGVAARESGFRSSVGTPITVEGRRWGVMAVGSSLEQGLPADTESRLVQFTELLATAVANAESRAGLARLAEEQAALRRVATLVARGAAPEEVFAAVTDEVVRLLPVDLANMGRYESDGTVTIIAAWGRAANQFPVGSRPSLAGNNLLTIVAQTGRLARIDSYADASGPAGVAARETGISSGA
jgi:GAF domain-containing protein